jgi:hypothetical protein
MAVSGRIKIMVLCLLAAATPALAAPVDSSDVRVIDGDTIRVHHKRPDVRLVGFNAPETVRAACAAEGELGAKATRRLRDLVRDGNLDFEFVVCSCPPGTEGTNACNYGRRCGTLKANGRNVPHGPPMTLGNMRELGVNHLIGYCHNDACRHQALIDVSDRPDDVEITWFQRRAKSSKCGGKQVDVRPN